MSNRKWTLNAESWAGHEKITSSVTNHHSLTLPPCNYCLFNKHPLILSPTAFFTHFSSHLWFVFTRLSLPLSRLPFKKVYFSSHALQTKLMEPWYSCWCEKYKKIYVDLSCYELYMGACPVQVLHVQAVERGKMKEIERLYVWQWVIGMSDGVCSVWRHVYCGHADPLVCMFVYALKPPCDIKKHLKESEGTGV